MITFVMFIINTINPVTEKESPESSTLSHLAELIQATESFYHPSNYGKWSYVLALFLEALARDYLERWNEGICESFSFWAYWCDDKLRHINPH